MPLAIIQRAVLIVTAAAAALRAVLRLFQIFSLPDDPQPLIPSASGVRSCMLRLGLFSLREPLPVADDWFFLIDHIVIG